jgi:hypothetical protein
LLFHLRRGGACLLGNVAILALTSRRDPQTRFEWGILLFTAARVTKNKKGHCLGPE